MHLVRLVGRSDLRSVFVGLVANVPSVAAACAASASDTDDSNEQAEPRVETLDHLHPGQTWPYDVNIDWIPGPT